MANIWFALSLFIEIVLLHLSTPSNPSELSYWLTSLSESTEETGLVALQGELHENGQCAVRTLLRT